LAAPAALACLLGVHSAPAAAEGRGGGDRLATASAPEQPKLLLERRGGAVRYGAKPTLVATLSASGGPLAGRTVSLHTPTALVASGATDAAGRVRFRVEAKRSVGYEARFVPSSPEDVAAYLAATSGGLDLVVRPVVRLRPKNPLGARRRIVGVPRERLRVRGTVSPYVRGQRIVIRLLRRGREIRSRTRPVAESGARGRFGVSLRTPRRGAYTIRATQPEGEGLAAGSSRKRLVVVRPSARSGSRGIAVRALQRRLAKLGYLTAVNGHFGGSTARAVLAFRKANGMRRTTVANRSVFRRLARGGGAYRIRYPKAGKHVEFDWSRQVLVLARGARAVMTVHASSGTASTPTVLGSYRFYGKTPGFNSKQMYYSSYFIGGYAIHGYGSVPTYPASHGCIRIPIASAVRAYRWISVGDPIYTYR
jgi:peptidoglycan hydrolase-like protein with peptidoglycan-binding domain